MGKMQRDKGARVEREIVRRFRAHGIPAERVPLSGAMPFRDTRGADLDVYFHGLDQGAMVGEVKARKDDSGFRKLKQWQGDADFLIIKENGQEPLILMTFGTLMRILRKEPVIHCEGQSLATASPHNGPDLERLSDDKDRDK